MGRCREGVEVGRIWNMKGVGMGGTQGGTFRQTCSRKAVLLLTFYRII